LLEFAEGRANSREFFTLISRPAICKKFDLQESDLEVIRWWIEETNIAWGYDSEHKKSLNLPPFNENTWQNGIDRMLIGFCSGKSTNDQFDDLLPLDEIEGNRVGLLSKLITIVEALKKLSNICL
jgi:exodeoxyribonuclease V gamma subunit